MASSPVTSVILSSQATDGMAAEAGRWHPRESGGVLVGSVADGRVEVKQAVDAGPKATHRPSFFMRDQEYSEQQVNLHYEQSKGRVDYVGEWHSHSRVQGPSKTDITSMLQISKDVSNNIRFPVLIIAMRKRKRWEFKAYTPSQQMLLEIDVEILA